MFCVAPWPSVEEWHEILVRQDDRWLRVRLLLRSQDRSYQQGWAQQVDRLFRSLDVDNNGVLDAAEARRAPGQEQWQQMVSGERIIDPEAAPPFAHLAGPDGRVTPRSLKAYYAQSKAGPLRVTWFQHRPFAHTAASDKLGRLLLEPKSRKIDRKKLAALPGALRVLDTNDDEMISDAEMQERLDGYYQNPPREREGEPSGPAAFNIPLELRGLSDPLPRGASSKPDVVLILELVDTQKAPVRVVRAAKGIEVRTLRGGIQLNFPGMVLRIGVDVPRSSQTVRDDAKARFARLDQNRDLFLDSRELHLPPFEYVSWLRLADRDGDGKLSEAEFLSYSELLADWHGQRTVLRGTDDGSSLFSLLDLDGDRHLSLREQLEAARYMPPEGPKAARLPEIPRVLRIQVGRDDSPNATAQTQGSIPTVRRVPLVGPVWFQKMDTNRDGDISRREWLGTSEDFDRIDTDKDGLISLEEAIRFQRTFNK
jgi:Ca2+-binding EF-hand superfamily protein